MPSAQKLLWGTAGLFVLSAIQMICAPNAYFTGEVDFSRCEWEKYQMMTFLMMWNLNNAFIAYAQSLNPTKETCACNIAIWIMWTIFHVFGCVFSPMHDAAGIDKGAIIVWPLMGAGFVYSWFKAMGQIEEKASTAGYTIPLAHAVAQVLFLMNIAVFLGHPSGADAMYYPNMPLTDAAGEVFNAFNKVHTGLFSITNMMSFYTMKNSTKAQDHVIAACWGLWGLFFVWLVFIDRTMLQKLGADKNQFMSWIFTCFGIAALFVKKEAAKVTKVEKRN